MMWVSQQGMDASQLVGAITTHLIIVMCILLISAVNNSIAEEEYGPNPDSHPKQASSKEVQPEVQADNVQSNIQSQPEDDADNKCWITEDYDHEGPCEPCSDIAILHSPYCCGETGFRQKVLCKTSGKIAFKSCPRSRWSIEKGFWTFEGIMFALGMCSGIVALIRRRKLDWKALERVRKQIANSV